MRWSRRWLLASAGGALFAGSAGCVARDGTRTVTDGTGGIAYEAATLRAGAVDGEYDGESYCAVAAGLADALGVDAGMQLRVGAADPAADAPFGEKLFTVATVGGGLPAGAVRATAADLADVGARDGGAGRVSATVPHPTLDVEAAAAADEFVETVHAPGVVGAAPVVLLAPHGGGVEPSTGEQVAHAAERFDLPGWACHGFDDGGGAFDRWHVTSTALSPRSFPRLAEVTADSYPRAVAFHGQTDDHVTVGGAATPLREPVAAALRDAYDRADVGVAVRVADGGENAGVSGDNVVNWATESGAGGLQVEQPMAVRDDLAERTAEVVVRTVLDRTG